jgi:thiol-disulfide isomerase/thioredoxin
MPFPSMGIFDLKGKNIELNHVKLGKYTFYDFWYSTCGPCNKQIPELKTIYSKWHDHGLELIGIATDYQRFEKELKSAIKKHDLKWPQYWDHDFIQSNKYSIIYFPTNFLLDMDGVVIARNIDLDDLDKFLESKLK